MDGGVLILPGTGRGTMRKHGGGGAPHRMSYEEGPPPVSAPRCHLAVPGRNENVFPRGNFHPTLPD